MKKHKMRQSFIVAAMISACIFSSKNDVFVRNGAIPSNGKTPLGPFLMETF